MAKEAIKLPPALRALQERHDVLVKDELQAVNQLSFLTRELRKQKRTAQELEKSISRVQEAYSSLKKAPVASLPEYKDLRLLLPTNKHLLDRVKKEIRKNEQAKDALKDQLRHIKTERERIERELTTWNRLVKFDRK